MIEMTRQQVLQALADGGSADEFAVHYQAWSGRGPDRLAYWANALVQHTPGWTFYRKQKTHMVNGFEVEAPMTEAPSVEDVYYTARPDIDEWYGAQLAATNGEWHSQTVARRCYFATKEGAIANAKAQLGFDPNGETP